MRGRIDPHARYRELIAARLDRPLTRVELRSLTSHLKKCDSCVGVEAEYRAHRSMLRALPPTIPPRDLWARTSSSLDREVARAYRARKWRRRMARGRKQAQRSTGLMTAIAAIGVTAALAVLQLAPANLPIPTEMLRPTPLRVPPQQFVMLGLGAGSSDVAVYRTQVSQVCPPSAPLDCVENESYVRTPVGLPTDMRPGNISLSPRGDQLALVGHYVGEDVIAVVQMPPDAVNNSDAGGNDGSGSGQKSSPAPDDNSSGNGNGANDNGGKNRTPDATAIVAAEHASPRPAGGNDPNASAAPAGNGDEPSAQPAPASPGQVVAILENVQSVGAPPDWAANGETLAFSAVPDDESTGPDIYLWSPGDARARAITTDHSSYFASWSGNRIVVSRLTGNGRPRTFVIDPRSLEERAVSGPQLWLPSVSSDRTQAVGWFGQLDLSAAQPTLRSGALYLTDWASVDPFGAAAPTPTPTATATPQPSDAPKPTEPSEPAATVEPSAEPSAEPTQGEVDASPAADATAAPDATDEPDPTVTTDPTLEPTATQEAGSSTNPDASEPPAATEAPTQQTATDAPQIPTPQPANEGPRETPAADSADLLVPLEPDRDPHAAPVVDWQASWSADDAVLGVWIADSAGSTWGRLGVYAVDEQAHKVLADDPLLTMTMARRGFSLGQDRVAWVGPSEDNVDGELRIRTWGSDGVGGLRLKAPDQGEVVPAS